MLIGLYFGSFNPVHIGHLIIANHLLTSSVVSKVWFVVSPQNPLKEQTQLLNEYHRLHLLRLAIEDNVNFSASDIEFHLPRPSYTIDTLTYLTEKNKDKEFAVIMGSDSYQNLPRWKNWQTLLAHYKIFVYNRPGYNVSQPHPNVTVLEAPLLQISATHIRELLRQKKSIKYLVPEKVEREILAERYYQR